MRATWPGARSGRISMVTGPCVVSRIRVFSVALMLVSLALEGKSCQVNFAATELDPERMAPGGAGHCIGKWHRRAALQRLHHRDPVLQPVVVEGLRGFIGNPRMAQNVSGPVKAQAPRRAMSFSFALSYLMSEATWTFTILSGSVT